MCVCVQNEGSDWADDEVNYQGASFYNVSRWIFGSSHTLEMLNVLWDCCKQNRRKKWQKWSLPFNHLSQIRTTSIRKRKLESLRLGENKYGESE